MSWQSHPGPDRQRCRPSDKCRKPSLIRLNGHWAWRSTNVDNQKSASVLTSLNLHLTRVFHVIPVTTKSQSPASMATAPEVVTLVMMEFLKELVKDIVSKLPWPSASSSLLTDQSASEKMSSPLLFIRPGNICRGTTHMRVAVCRPQLYT